MSSNAMPASSELSAIAEAGQALGARIDELDRQLHGLSVDIGMVLRPQSPSESAKVGGKLFGDSDLAIMLGEYVSRLGQMTDFLDDITQRIEL